MFTGIIECTGKINSITREKKNIHFEISSEISDELTVDQSVSHNGVCLTVTKVEGNNHWVTAIDETLSRSNLGVLKIGDEINLERCMAMNGRLDGHIVQGHVDRTTEVVEVLDEDGSWRYFFRLYPEDRKYFVEKGSVSINGVSLTVADLEMDRFSVAIIPYTYEMTNFKQLKPGHQVNIEFDIVGKYILRNLEVEGILEGYKQET